VTQPIPEWLRDVPMFRQGGAPVPELNGYPMFTFERLSHTECRVCVGRDSCPRGSSGLVWSKVAEEIYG